MASVLAAITILLLTGYVITAALRKSSAALRHVVWTCVIAATLVYPPLHWIVPHRVIRQEIPVVSVPTVRIDTAGSVQNASSSKADAFSASEIAITIWALGSILLAIRFAARVMQFRLLMTDVKAVDAAFPVPILTSTRIPGPIVTGIFRPRIVLPDGNAAWTPSRRRAVLAHELAHIRRRDPAILLMAQAATIVYWFHPLCWLAAARLRTESERACDDAALRIGLRPSRYAGELLDLARLFNPQPAIPMATASNLESRVKFILDPFVNRSFAPRRAWLVAAALTTAFTVPVSVLSLYAQRPGRGGGISVQTAGGGTITGSVSDPTGAVVPRVQVIASNMEGGNKEIATSDAIGNFAFNNIPAGNYSIEAHAPGFTASRLDLTLSNGGTVVAPVRLKVGSVGEQITVVAAGRAKPMTSATAGTARPIRVGGNVQPASLVEQVRPVYPEAMQAVGIEGTVLMEAVISKEGTPISLVPQNTSIDPAFVSAAMDAVRQWRYRPALLNGEPIEVLTTISVDFKLQVPGN
jgi:TonB family protein